MRWNSPRGKYAGGDGARSAGAQASDLHEKQGARIAKSKVDGNVRRAMPGTLPELMQRTGYDRQKVQRSLDRLKQKRLVTLREGVWYAEFRG